MKSRTYRIRGTRGTVENVPMTSQVTIESHKRLIPGRARDGVTDELDVSADEVVRVELQNGFVHWIRADDLVREYGEHSVSRDGVDVWEVESLMPRLARQDSDGERGFLGIAIKVLDFFGISLDKKIAEGLGSLAEHKLLKGNKPGFYRCSLKDEFSLQPVAKNTRIPVNKGPILVFIHGTASSCEGSFGKLWDPKNRAGLEARQRFTQIYDDRVFALEHLSLTQSPVINALELAKRLPKGGEIHLVSHSRGGLVGELLCLSGCDQLEKLLDNEGITRLFDGDNTIWEQLGLSPLDDKAMELRKAAYENDRKHLVDLVSQLNGRFKVKRFVRVACPARGTTLASGRLDRWLSMISFLLDKATGGGLLGDGADFLLSVIKQRTDPRTLPGLEAMMPGSALTRLLHYPQLETRADLSVISGDMDGGSLFERLSLKRLVSNWFYSADNDLVVNTGSMSGGLKRIGSGARYRKAQGPEVDHFSYFGNRESIQWLVSGLSRGDADDGGFRPIEEAQKESPRWRDAVLRSQASTRPQPLAVVLPGTMGSELAVNDERIWLDYLKLFLGGLKKLDINGREPVSTTNRILDDFYGPLLEFLARTHRVEVFAYDWRRSVRDAAERLADRLEMLLPRAEKEGQPVHLVAHSMGGLVVRALIADTKRGNALWRRITRLPNSRLLMLGTPNLGSYEAVRWLTGNNPTQAKLSLLDITQSTVAIVNLVREFPGLLELLPFGPQDVDFSDTQQWRTITKTLNARWKTARAADLRAVSETWDRLRQSPLDPGHMCYVAGCQPATVIGYRFAEYEEPWLVGRKRLEFLATPDGDGTVSWASGRLPDIGTWYVEDTAHDELCARQKAFSGYLELLMTGTTRRLPESPPRTSREAMGAERIFVLPALPPADSIPGPGDLPGFGFGGGVRIDETDVQPAAPVVEVTISHGDLSYACYPVMVGHYMDDSILSAEAVLDSALDGALKSSLDMGLYPGRLNTHRVFFNHDAQAKPAGALVVGLGQVGELTPGLLQAGVTNTLLEYALQLSQWPDSRFGEPGAPRNASVTCLLIGTSAGGMTTSDSMEAILRGARDANQKLMHAHLDNRVTIDQLEFIELYEDMALMAVDAMRTILTDGELAQAVRWTDQTLNRGQAGRKRAYFDESPGWWHRLEIIEDEHQPDTLCFNFTTDRARAEETLSRGQLKLAENFVRKASSSARSNQDVAMTLYEILLPVRIREQAPRQTDLVLLVDELSARFPWELLEDRWGRDRRPPSVRAGMIRQLKTQVFRERPRHGSGATALVIGHPDLNGWELFSELPGARQEALSVAQKLSLGGYEVKDSIDQPADSILEALHSDAWRILHLSGHGVHQFPRNTDDSSFVHDLYQSTQPSHYDSAISGMVIGRDMLLTPGDVEQMRWVPELVFINCCHLGKTGSEREFDRGGLAANLGVAFIRMGVRAVVAAGWAVHDDAARTFAETFYQHMLQGEEFGEAVRRSREETLLRYPDTNTWGAYQCYGDHSFRLHRDSRSHNRKPKPFSSPSELIIELENLTSGLKVGGEYKEQKLEETLVGILKRIPAEKSGSWTKRADVAAAIGLTWGEARRWDEAIEWLEKALRGESGDCPVRAVEQCANYRVRQAVEAWMQVRGANGREQASKRKEIIPIIEAAIVEIDTLCQRAPTIERLNLLGSACKRLAQVQNNKALRKESLQKMANYYHEGYELSGRKSTYAYTNWASALMLLRRQGLAEKLLDEHGLVEDATRLRQALKIRNDRKPNFWDSASLADIDLVLLLISSHDDRRDGSACQVLVDGITDIYQKAVQRGASPRERASIIENIDFLIDLIEGGSPLQEDLIKIREAL
ncbi:MAG: alpha/beta fold hydrolase [Candidatus Thiodiazotropha sp.]